MIGHWSIEVLDEGEIFEGYKYKSNGRYMYQLPSVIHSKGSKYQVSNHLTVENDAKYIKHSCKPNAMIKTVRKLVEYELNNCDIFSIEVLCTKEGR